MAYSKTTWQDEVLSGAERFEILDNAGAAADAWADLENCQIQLATSVTTAGTALNASNLNNMETGIDEAHDAIDDLETFVDKIHRGRVTSAGAGEELPSGWSSSRFSTGIFIVTHNLGSTDYTVVITPQIPSTTPLFACVYSRAANSVSVAIVNDSGSAVNSDFDFILIED
jgi:hypothetical protein